MADNIWSDRFIKRELISAGELAQRFNIKNPRLHPEAQKDATEASLDKVGWIDDVSLSTNGDGAPSLADNPAAVLFDGHERVELALLRGGPEMPVPVRWYQLTPEETDFALLVKDQTSAMAQIDAEKMGALMERAKAMTSAPGLQGMLERLKEQVASSIMPDFQPTNGSEQPRLDRLEPVYCPHCGKNIRDEPETEAVTTG